MADSYLEDKSKYRANQYAATWSGGEPYDVDDKIGRADYVKVKVTTEYATEYGGTVSGTEGAILV
jgi:hypothetical protein